MDIAYWVRVQRSFEGQNFMSQKMPNNEAQFFFAKSNLKLWPFFNGEQ